MWIAHENKLMELLNIYFKSPRVLNNFDIIIKLKDGTLFKSIIAGQITNKAAIPCNFVMVLPFHAALTDKIKTFIMIICFKAYFIGDWMANFIQLPFLRED